MEARISKLRQAHRYVHDAYGFILFSGRSVSFASIPCMIWNGAELALVGYDLLLVVVRTVLGMQSGGVARTFASLTVGSS